MVKGVLVKQLGWMLLVSTAALCHIQVSPNSMHSSFHRKIIHDDNVLVTPQFAKDEGRKQNDDSL
jgi:hypothetical protein